jgi:hypothetical protein
VIDDMTQEICRCVRWGEIFYSRAQFERHFCIADLPSFKREWR